MKAPVVRTFVSADIPAALALWQATPGLGLDGSDSPAALTAFLQRNPGCSRVVLINDEIVATLLCGHDGRRGFLYHLAVAPAHRRRGLGRALCQACVEHLQRCGIRRVTLHLFANNDEGKAFWRSTGWKDRDDLLVVQFNAPA